MIETYSRIIGKWRVSGPLETAVDDHGEGFVEGQELARWERSAAVALLTNAGIDPGLVTWVRKTMGVRKADVRADQFTVEPAPKEYGQ